MTLLEFPDYLSHIRSESQRFRDVLADCDPAARVPGCPEWDAGDLLWHLAGVQYFWAALIRNRPAGPQEVEEPVRPATYADTLAAFDEHSASLVAALDAADPTEPAWSWAPEQTVGFTFRRQAHEALVHRLDAEQTAGRVTALDVTLATDGVAEVLGVMFGGQPSWGTFAPLPHHVRFDVADADTSLWVQLGRFTGTDPESDVTHDVDDIRLVTDPGVEADAVVVGPAGALDAWLWRRDDDSAITVHGDRAVYDRFRSTIDSPIN